MASPTTSNFHLRRKERLHTEIAVWAAEHAGTDLDLDRDLERSGLETLDSEPS